MIRKLFFEPEWERAFKDRGYFTLPLLNPQECKHLLQVYGEMHPSNEGLKFHSTMHIEGAQFRRNVDRAIRAVVSPKVEQLLIDYEVLFSNYIVKEPGADSAVGVHQDWSYVNEQRHRSVNIWCPLVDTNEINGALCVLPGSHLMTAPQRFTPYELPPYFELFDKIKEKSLRIDLKAGQAVVYQSNLLHFSEPNQSEVSRPAIGWVNVPQEAQPIHYHKIPDSEDLQILHAPSDFYYQLRINQPPPETQQLGIEKMKTDCFSAEELDALSRSYNTNATS